VEHAFFGHGHGQSADGAVPKGVGGPPPIVPGERALAAPHPPIDRLPQNAHQRERFDADARSREPFAQRPEQNAERQRRERPRLSIDQVSPNMEDRDRKSVSSAVRDDAARLRPPPRESMWVEAPTSDRDELSG
jgi:hypothetical protein